VIVIPYLLGIDPYVRLKSLGYYFWVIQYIINLTFSLIGLRMLYKTITEYQE